MTATRRGGRPLTLEAANADAIERADPGLAAGYRRSWVNALIDGVERLPGPTWAAYVVGLVVMVLILLSGDWMSGVPVGQIKPDRIVWGAAIIGSAWLIHHLDRVARSSLRDFAPLLGAAPAEMPALEAELSFIPPIPSLVILVISAFRTAEGFAFQPETEGIVGLVPLAIGLRFLFEIGLTSLILILVYHTVRQLRSVGRIHALAPRVNLLRPAPLYAFSRLTSQTAMGLVLLTIPFLGNLSVATTTIDYVTWFGILGLILGTAVLAFLLPLLGMHRRMGDEKHRLQDEVGSRIERLIGELHGSIDQNDLTRADGQNKTLASLIAERELVHRLSTWPWQAGTATAVGSALLLPIGLFLVTRLLERALS